MSDKIKSVPSVSINLTGLSGDRAEFQFRHDKLLEGSGIKHQVVCDDTWTRRRAGWSARGQPATRTGRLLSSLIDVVPRPVMDCVDQADADDERGRDDCPSLKH